MRDPRIAAIALLAVLSVTNLSMALSGSVWLVVVLNVVAAAIATGVGAWLYTTLPLGW